jgi:hypothetical protein
MILQINSDSTWKPKNLKPHPYGIFQKKAKQLILLACFASLRFKLIFPGFLTENPFFQTRYETAGYARSKRLATTNIPEQMNPVKSQSF